MTDAERAEAYRLAIAREIMLRFHDAHGRMPTTNDELHAWAGGQVEKWEQPVKPRPQAFRDFVSAK